MNAKRIAAVVSSVLMAALLVSCQAVFTYSPLSAFQRNPANMTPQQQINYAEQALKSGDPATMKSAFDAIKGSTDPNVQLVAGQLAFGASGATDALAEALAASAAGNAMPANNTTLQNVDATLAIEGAQAIENAAAGGAPVTDSEWATASASYLVAAAQLAGGFDQLANLTNSSQPGYTELQQAKSLETNIQSPDLVNMIQSFY